ncbi:hypothetical protein [Nevskia soli]|uniref:hypothetical protein n=1 Tax=Nevskia soli TaxID=418856 RepID=UPI0012FA2403|nr:hypothetical protein [Nevskia soli]
MTQSIGLQTSEAVPAQAPRRGKLRRPAKSSGERRSQFLRSDVRRGATSMQDALTADSSEETAGQAQEKLATLRVQASIVAAMLGMLVFFRTPLAAALSSLFG